ncbi:MAG: hydrogenase formation protein HypD [Myxococcales bacterium]|nr:hydrogenase formation protein HypD [Myxococcales bacterium]
MKYVSEFRDPPAARRLVATIESLMSRRPKTLQGAPLKIMEVCGGHTHAIFKFGLETLLPETIELVHGPGCPVCVLPVGRVDDAISIATSEGVIFCTYGDALRVPGSRTSLAGAKAEGADVRTVYSPTDALALARANPSRRVVFFGLGFETTAPSTALTLLQAEREGVSNFFVFSNHVTIIPALRALLDAEDLQVDGFIGPGHVSMVIGVEPYHFIAEHYRRPFVVSGFEPLDVLQSIAMVVAQHVEGRAVVENQYSRLVSTQGNSAAQTAIHEVFKPRAHFEWRGLGSIAESGLELQPRFARFDAEQAFRVPALSVADPKACQCGEVLKGQLRPYECKVFGTACTPETPIGSCMVSSEGACAAYYSYGRLTSLRRASGLKVHP